MANIEPHEVLLNSKRARILAFLRLSEGATLTQVARQVRVHQSTVLWHLYKLQDARLIRRAGQRYVVAANTGVPIAVSLLKSPAARLLMADLVKHPWSTLEECSKRLGRTRSYFWRDLPRLVEGKLVARRRRRHAFILAPTALARTAWTHVPRTRLRGLIPPTRMAKQ